MQLSETKVPIRHRGFLPEDSISEEWTMVYMRLAEMVSNGDVLAGIVGGRGCGKTQLGACLIRKVITPPPPDPDVYIAPGGWKPTAMYAKAMDVFLSVRDNMRAKDGSERDAIALYAAPTLLVIDAYEVRGDTDFENRVLNHIIDLRYDDRKSTVIISNDTVESFAAQLGDSICDRMRECGGIIELKTSSLRVNREKKCGD